jgi:hypothetical protein
MLMEVHAAARLAEQRFGHERDSLPAQVRGHLGDVLDHHGRVARLDQPHHRGLDLHLAWAADLMVMVLDRHAHQLESPHHVGAQVEQLIFGRDGMIATMRRDVMSVPALRTVPVRFPAHHLVAGAVDARFVADAVEDVKLEFRPPAAFVRDARGTHKLLGAAGNVARVIGERGVRVGFESSADKAQGNGIPERVQKARREVWDEHHVTRFDGFKSNG